MLRVGFIGTLCAAPYYTWSEKADGTGNVPYLTSGGGFLQSIIYGYAGIRVCTDYRLDDRHRLSGLLCLA